MKLLKLVVRTELYLHTSWGIILGVLLLHRCGVSLRSIKPDPGTWVAIVQSAFFLYLLFSETV